MKPVDDNWLFTEFHCTKTPRHPAVNYSVDVLIDGVQVGTRAFKVAD